MKFYSGIGSRKLPKTKYRECFRLAKHLEEREYTLRSGNATGTDQAFAYGVRENAQIWLPTEDFNKDFKIMRKNHKYLVIDNSDTEAFDSVYSYHPNVKALNHMSFRMMARNYRQVVGRDEPDSQFVICWTEGGAEVGGTAQAMRIAKARHIPIFNLFNMSVDEIIKEIDKLNLLQ